MNRTASCMITGHLVAALCRTTKISSSDHALLMKDGREEILRIHAEEAETALGEAWDAASNMDAWRLGRILRTGLWILVLPLTVNGTELRAKEWRDCLLLSYGIKPPDLMSH